MTSVKPVGLREEEDRANAPCAEPQHPTAEFVVNIARGHDGRSTLVSANCKAASLFAMRVAGMSY